MLLKKGIILLLLPLFSFVVVHKYYLSATEVVYSEKNKTLQITSRYFIDDFEKTLEERYLIKPQLSSSKELKGIDQYFDKYLSDKFIITFNEQILKLTFLGKEYDNDVVKCYFESEKINFKKNNSIEIINSSLFEMFEEQQNIIHLQINTTKKSYNLHKENNTALLSF